METFHRLFCVTHFNKHEGSFLMAVKQKQKRAAILIRMSTDQQKDSPERQRANIMPLVDREEYRVVGEYSDEGISGVKTSKREGLRRLIDDAKVGKFDVVIVDSIDRFSRLDSVEVGKLVEPLRAAGVSMHSVSEGLVDWNDFTGRIMFMLRSELGNDWLKGHAYKTSTGRLRKILAGETTVVTAFGLDRVFFDSSGKEVYRVGWNERFKKPDGWTSRNEPSSDPDIRNAVQYAFRRFAETPISLTRLAKEMRAKFSDDRFPDWFSSNLKPMLSHPAYVGDMPLGRYSCGAFYQISKDGVSESRGEIQMKNRDPVQVIRGTHEAIIERDVFDAVQARLKTLPKSKRGPAMKWPLSGILVCAKCGWSITGWPVKGKRTVDYYKHRPDTYDSHGCEFANLSIRARELEKFVVRRVVDRLDGFRDELQLAVQRKLEMLDSSASVDTNALLRQQSRLESRIRKGQRNLFEADTEDVPALKELLSEARVELELVNERLSGSKKPRNQSLRCESVLAEIEELKRGIIGSRGPELRDFLTSVVDRIEIRFGDTGLSRQRLLGGTVFFV